MIVFPSPWQYIGQPISPSEIEDTIYHVLEDQEIYPCNCIAFSGGLDSSLMLYFMTRIHKKVEAFTIGLNGNHPDVIFSKKFASTLPGVNHRVFIPSGDQLGEQGDTGDYIVRAFFNYVGKFTDAIITCDGIDEFMAGYYKHQGALTEYRYFKILQELKECHLKPLDRNSGNVKVILPYLAEKLILLYGQIPLQEKVDNENRKKIMRKLAAGKIPREIIDRRKYGFCDALKIKT